MVKQLRQVAGVRQVKVVDYKKGRFALTPNKGGKLSEGAIAAAVKRSGFTLQRIVSPGVSPKSQPRSSQRPSLPGNRIAVPVLTKELAPARDAFRKREYNLAIKLAGEVAERKTGNPQTDQTPNRKNGKQGEKKFAANPRTAEVQQQLSLAYFAQGKYREAFTAAHVALHRGTPWGWKQLSGHYEKPKEYSTQLRALEQQIREKPSAELRFLIGYHYLMLGHTEAARSQLTRVAKQKPDDMLIRELLRQLEQKPRLKNP